MANDYEDLYGFEHLDDDEIADLVYAEFEEYPELDPDLLDVQVEDGFVRVEGRVGTEQELQQVEHVLTDLLGIRSYSNDIVIDELVRAERSEAADEAYAQEREAEPSRGEPADRTDPEASHLLEDLEGDLYGSRDYPGSRARGQTYEPPDRPVQEGTWSEENH